MSAHRSVVLLDLRGTGESAVPADPPSYRCGRLVDDVEALRMHLGLDRIDLLGHSAGATLALRYAARHLDRVDRLVLVTPSPRAVGLEITDLDRRHVAEQRRGEASFPYAFAAFQRIGRAAPPPLTGRRSHRVGVVGLPRRLGTADGGPGYVLGQIPLASTRCRRPATSA